ncbi:MAG: sensor histidine kinase [Acidobacteria bacterium]|nr:sensor histidine kinase [Acidobacteriota bacterium]
MLREIPSPSTRLGVGLCITLAIFGVFVVYALHEIRWLEDFQVNVVQKNRQASLQLLRVQNDAYLLAVLIRDMTLPDSRYPIAYYRTEFNRLHEDMDEALKREEQYAVASQAAREQRTQLKNILVDIWMTADLAFDMAEDGHEVSARYLIKTQLERKREVVSKIVAGLLDLNDQAQREAGDRINAVYSNVKREILFVVAALLLLVLGTGLYTLQANRKTFEKLHHLAERLQIQNEQLAALYDAIHAVSQEQEPNKVLQDSCEQLSRALGIARVLFFRHDAGEGRFAPEAACGLDENPELADAAQKALASSPPPADSNEPFRLASAGLTEILALPLRVGSSLHGVFVLCPEEESGTPSGEDLRLASKIVEATLGPLKNAQLLAQLKIQSEQLRKLSWKLIEVQEETLRHVARDLHDEFGQILTAIGVMLGRAGQKGLDKDSPFVQDVQQVKKIVEDTLQSVRDSSQIFRPAILDDFGLEQTLDWFITQFSNQTGIRVNFERDLADGFFPAEDAIHVYRIIQEALNNVARHSKAREAWVLLKETEGELRLEVRDDGAGFEVGGEVDRRLGEGLGLMGMRERTEHLNGTLAITSASHRGTVVRARIPLKKPAARAAAEKVS